MKEIEVKARARDFKKLMNSLREMGCKFSEPIYQNDRIFLDKNIKFSDIKKDTNIMRIRDSNGIFILTLKIHLENELDCIEREIIVNDSKQAEDILFYLGFREVIRVKKKRIKIKYKDLEICLDEVEGLGNFIEIEKIIKEGDSLKIQEELFKFLESLGVKREDKVFQGYDSLIYNLNLLSKQNSEKK